MPKSPKNLEIEHKSLHAWLERDGLSVKAKCNKLQ